ncbi:MAG: agmatinase [Deltaproteobacteria bacterium]|nr:agmatinase [Deltaproteobacteria bacterium]
MDLGEDLSQAIAMAAAYAGELSFGRRQYTRELKGVDITVVGIPFDQGTTNRPGARLGPRAIREQSSLVACYPWGLWPWDFNVFERVRVIDYSDLAFPPGYASRMMEAVDFHVSRIIEAGSAVLTLGGDHTVAYPLLRAHTQRHGRLSLIHFDAHSDTWDLGDDVNHGTPFFLAAREGLVDPARSVHVGIRTPNPETHGFTVIDADRLLDQGVEAVARTIRDVVGSNAAYLSFDVDFLDPAYAPGTGTPVVGGPTTQQARRLLRGLAGLRIVGADVVEVAPPFDPAGQTALAAATIAHDLLYLISIGRRPRQ